MSVASLETPEKKVTKKALRERCQDLLRNSPVDTYISTSSEDGQFLLSILARHPQSRLKIQCGVMHFEVRRNLIHGGASKGFWIVRLDGTETEFSFHACLSPPNHEKRVKTLLRQVVTRDITRFKAEHGGGPGDDVHHEIEFDRICEAWVSFRGGYDRIKLAPAKDGQFGRQFADPVAELDFLRFHRAHARLSVLPRKQHQRLRSQEAA